MEAEQLIELERAGKAALSEGLARLELAAMGLITVGCPLGVAAVLRYPCLAVEAGGFDEALRARAARLVEIMHEPGPLACGMLGVGLAANQAGWMQRVFCAYVPHGMPGGAPDAPAVYVNPRITWRHPRSSFEFESCLSCPGRSVKVQRSNAVVIEYEDLWGKACCDKSSGLLARVWQHEIDHLDGKLIIDRAKGGAA